MRTIQKTGIMLEMHSLLLDTCAVIWLASGSDLISKRTRQFIDEASIVYVSPISMWEIARKERKGTLVLPLPPKEWFDRVIEQHDLSVLPLTPETMFHAAGLPDIHKDPADRFIIAAALLEKLPVITADANFPRYGVTCMI